MVTAEQLHEDFANRVRAAKEMRLAEARDRAELFEEAERRVARLTRFIETLGATLARELGEPAGILAEPIDRWERGFNQSYSITRDDGNGTKLFLEVSLAKPEQGFKLVLADELDSDEQWERSFELSEQGVASAEEAVSTAIAQFFEKKIDEDTAH